ncbi:hypothetical protein E2C01_068415 [Portunus trituberculatus]|uniref:Uncharacterized protein n=1 Tax=Portunus trituberculatus TaxID=210409 RepID=A0A5B7HNS4_PORTR|nr:hypothetical protein [Portunus trituberculatus]
MCVGCGFLAGHEAAGRGKPGRVLQGTVRVKVGLRAVFVVLWGGAETEICDGVGAGYVRGVRLTDKHERMHRKKSDITTHEHAYETTTVTRRYSDGGDLVTIGYDCDECLRFLGLVMTTIPHVESVTGETGAHFLVAEKKSWFLLQVRKGKAEADGR